MSSGQERVQGDNPLRLFFDERSLRLEFVSLFQASGNPECLILTAIQRFPEADDLPPPNVPPDQLSPSGRVVGRFAITWPHAERLRDLLTRLIEQYKADKGEADEHVGQGEAGNDV